MYRQHTKSIDVSFCSKINRVKQSFWNDMSDFSPETHFLPNSVRRHLCNCGVCSISQVAKLARKGRTNSRSLMKPQRRKPEGVKAGGAMWSCTTVHQPGERLSRKSQTSVNWRTVLLGSKNYHPDRSTVE